MRRLNVTPSRVTYSARANHDDWTLRVSRKAEGGPTDMDGGFIDGPFAMSASGTLDSVGREEVRRGTLAVGSIFEVEKEIGANAEDGARWNPRTGGLVFEHDTGDMDRIRVKLRTRGDRVVPRLETRD